MLKPQLVHQSQSVQPLVPLPKPFIHGVGLPLICIRPSLLCPQNKHNNARLGAVPGDVKAVLSGAEKSIKVKAVVTVSPTVGGVLANLGLERGLDDIQDLLGKSLLVELVSAELDPKTGLEKETVKDYARRLGKDDDGGVLYEAEFVVPKTFGKVGAILVENEHHKEMFINDIVVDGFPYGSFNVSCNSWVHSKFDNPRKRVFFTNKARTF